MANRGDHGIRGRSQILFRQVRNIFRSRGALGFWYWTLFSVIAQIVAAVIDGILDLTLIEAILSLALLLPSLAVAVRRLHDIDRTGWWILIAFTGIGILLLLYWDCMKGTDGPNRFGPDPLAAG